MTKKKGKIKEKVFEAKLMGDEIVVWKDVEEIYDLGCYGKIINDRLILSPCEALHLIERKKLEVKECKKKLNKKKSLER